MKYRKYDLRLPDSTRARMREAATRSGLSTADWARRALDEAAERTLWLHPSSTTPTTSNTGEAA